MPGAPGGPTHHHMAIGSLPVFTATSFFISVALRGQSHHESQVRTRSRSLPPSTTASPCPAKSVLTPAPRSRGTRTAGPSPWEKRPFSCLVGKLRLEAQLGGFVGRLSSLPKPGTELGVWQGFRIVGVGSGDWGLFTGAKRWLPTILPPPPLAGTHTLQLARAQLSDSGMYTCEALNAAGRDQKLVQLNVLGTCRLSPHCTVPHSFHQPSHPSISTVRGGAACPGGAWDAL